MNTDYIHHDTRTDEPLQMQIETLTRWQDPTIEEKDKEIERLNKEKDDLDDCNRHLYNENKRLNNIINELEKWINEKDKYSTTLTPTIYIGEIQTKLKALKEGK